MKSSRTRSNDGRGFARIFLVSLVAISLQPLVAVFALLLVITMIVIVRQLSISIVSHFGISGGLVALAALFGVGYLWRD